MILFTGKVANRQDSVFEKAFYICLFFIFVIQYGHE